MFFALLLALAGCGAPASPAEQISGRTTSFADTTPSAAVVTSIADSAALSTGASAATPPDEVSNRSTATRTRTAPLC